MIPATLTYSQIIDNMLKMMAKAKVFNIKETWRNALIFMTGNMTVYYFIEDVPEEIRKDIGYVLDKNRLSIINDHFSD